MQMVTVIPPPVAMRRHVVTPELSRQRCMTMLLSDLDFLDRTEVDVRNADIRFRDDRLVDRRSKVAGTDRRCELGLIKIVGGFEFGNRVRQTVRR